MRLLSPGISIRSNSEKTPVAVRFLKTTVTGTAILLCDLTGRRIGCSAPARNASVKKVLMPSA